MRFKVLVFLAVLFSGLALMNSGGPALADEGRPAVQGGQPLAVMDSNNYAFEKVFEGEKVEHTFIIRNKGDAELIIERINTG
ncbi:MAG: DUF1573 domain-containing protein [Desulfatibacillaceae bacterium]|nr:DUF1573 domain-containing protein [Desulfatibacillaceae bacterium]